MPNELEIILLTACGLVACSRDVATGVRGSGREPVAGWSSSSAAGSGAAAPFDNGAIAGTPALGTPDDALIVHVENDRKMAIELITLGCSGDCADIEAVASGGSPPPYRGSDRALVPNNACPISTYACNKVATIFQVDEEQREAIEEVSERAPNVPERDFTADAPNEIWLDLDTRQGWLYLAVLIAL